MRTLEGARSDAILEAARALREGGLVVYPTDTLYGLGADATDARAVARLVAAKRRAPEKAIPVAVADLAAARQVAHVTPLAEKIAARHWPGAVTLVLSARPGILALAALGARDTVAIRVPGHPVALALLSACGRPLTATSANRSGGADPRTVEDARRELGDAVEVYLSAGPAGGVGSTIVDATGAAPKVLREGAVPAAEVVAAR
ncbi:MAG: L-threonylcarbamoyladenylate synthase [Methanobacteriota archaeon]